MPVNLSAPDRLLPVRGFLLGTAAAGIKHEKRDDIAVLVASEGTQASGVFTQSSFKAAPVQVAQSHLRLDSARALVINSGNANAATGGVGHEDAVDCCRWVAQAMGFKASQVLPFSTGVIGERLPMDRMKAGILDACGALNADAWQQAASAILTTDTLPKGISRRFHIGDSAVTITGIAKGSGMIRPNMATMLAFIGTDASISKACLDELLHTAVEASFNRITVDGDTSTNDSLMLLSSGQAANDHIERDSSEAYTVFQRELVALCEELAQGLIRDAEGATRFVTINVTGGRDRSECLKVAYTIAESPLVKTALFAGDPNWGRFCMAIGRSGITDLDVNGVSLFIGDVCVARNGMLDAGYTESEAARIMRDQEYCVRVELGRGQACETVWTSDLSYDYVKINAEYRT